MEPLDGRHKVYGRINPELAQSISQDIDKRLSEGYLNPRLHLRGFLFYSDLYESGGIRTPYGHRLDTRFLAYRAY